MRPRPDQDHQKMVLRPVSSTTTLPDSTIVIGRFALAQAVSKTDPNSLDFCLKIKLQSRLKYSLSHFFSTGLKDLTMSGCSSLCVSALSTQSCPGLRTLDLSWAVGVKDSQIKDLIVQPGETLIIIINETVCLV